MPKVTIYISDEDMPMWQAIKNRSRFVSEALNTRINQTNRGLNMVPPGIKGTGFFTPLDIPPASAPINHVEGVFKEPTQPAGRSKGEILKDIHIVEAERDEEVSYCQDWEERNKIKQRYQDELDVLWQEYKLVE